MDHLEFSKLPSPHKPSDVVRVVGWWHGGNREYADDFVLSGIGDDRPANASFYYIGAFVTAKEGHAQSIGEARFDIREISKGGALLSDIRRPYSGSGGDGRLKIPAGTYPKLKAPVGASPMAHSPENRGNMTKLIDQYMSHIGQYSIAHPFIGSVRMPHYLGPRYDCPGWTFAGLDPYQRENSFTLSRLLFVAKQRAGVEKDTEFSELDNQMKASVLSLFCTAYANSLPYTMDAHKGKMSEWFASPRFRKTGDCEDVSLDTMMVFRSLLAATGLGDYRELRDLQSFGKKYTCYMILGTATSASAGGKVTGNLMAHMYTLFLAKPGTGVPTALAEGTSGILQPIENDDDFFLPGLTPRGLAYTKEKMKGNDSFLGVFKRPLRGPATGDKTVVAEFYVHVCTGVPHDGSRMVVFLDENNKVGPLLKHILAGDSSKYRMEEIPGTGESDMNLDAKACLNDVKKANPPIRPLKIVGDEPAPQITNFVRGAVGDAFVTYLPAKEADFRLLYTFAVHRNREDFRKRFFGMLKKDSGKYEKVAFIPQIVNDRGEGAFEFRVKMKSSSDKLAVNGVTEQFARANVSIGIGGYCF